MITAEAKDKLLDLHNRYVECLDENRLEEWPKLFLEDGLYRILSRENEEANLTAYWMYFNHQRLMRDRIVALRKATVFNIHRNRHVTGNVRITESGDGQFDMKSNFVLVQTDVEGNSELSIAGVYRDKVVFENGEPKFRERTVVADTFNPPRILAVPV